MGEVHRPRAVGTIRVGAAEEFVEQLHEITDEPTTEREGRLGSKPPSGPIDAAGLSHPGRVRARNEDAFEIVSELGLAMVADGLGGHPAGDIASRMAVQEVADRMRDLDPDPTQPDLNDVEAVPRAAMDLVRFAVQQANSAIHSAGHRFPVVSGMGTTFAAVLIMRAFAIVAHVGDSRVYRLREGELRALTEDDSMAAEYMRTLGAAADPEIVRQHEGTLTRCLGAFPEVQVTMRAERRMPGDVYLLCTDGLWTTVPHEQMARILFESPDPVLAVQRLVDDANAAGGPDNITAVVVRPLGGEGASSTIPPRAD